VALRRADPSINKLLWQRVQQVFLTCFLLFAPWSSSFAEDTRKATWVVGSSVMRHSLQAGPSHELVGKAGQVSLGGGWISQRWLTSVTLDILMGPWEPSSAQSLDVDWSGTGGTWWTGWSARNLDLRSPQGSYGVGLGLNYADMVGRSIGRNRRDPGDPSDPRAVGIVDNYVMRVNNLGVSAALFFTWLAPARPQGNSPELLKTRLEGSVLWIGATVPVASSWNAAFDRRIAPATEGFPTVKEQVRERGRLKGWTVFASIQAGLGI
jgi:hypothetical protein